MTDNTDLKRLAEAAPEGPWFGPEYAPGTSYVFDVDLGTLLEYQSIDSEKDACLRYVAAANPAMVLALIAENERLAAACERAEQIIIAECKGASLANVRSNLLEAERDRLRAEIAGLKTGYEAYERVNAELKAEVQGLRGVMACVVSEVPSHTNRNGNAPGHCHSIPGVWDRDNGAKAGTECGWCKVWNAAVAMSKEPAHD